MTYEREKHADPVDQARYQTEKWLEDQIAKKRAELDGEGTEDCEECGEPIPEARRKALKSARYCVDCQGAKEQRR